MAHENLKFKLDVNNQKDYQPILGSQDYGTFHMVYVRIKKYEIVTKTDGIKQHNYTCDFKIQNFIGNITIGFSKPKPTINLGSSMNTDQDPIDATIKLAIEPFSTKTVVKNVLVELAKPLSKGMILFTDFTRNKPGKKLYNPLKPEKSKFLNPYRFERDGEDYLEISQRTFGSGESFPEPGGMDFFYPRGFCVPNRSVII
ncbi:MAG: hypothetical protein WAO74_13555 [Polaribacter sp.]|uniref:hypothetical protein n=1 Tax=Polaribacter sp. TaxID=1920175 RepID=UPI003BB15BC4